jgi:hypothetical protein
MFSFLSSLQIQKRHSILPLRDTGDFQVTVDHKELGRSLSHLYNKKRVKQTENQLILDSSENFAHQENHCPQLKRHMVTICYSTSPGAENS